MKPIVKEAGITPSERYLAKLAEHTFLNLWSWPNIYIDKKVNGQPGGKELCDLLVVCGDHLIIFSDKSIEWPDDDDVDLAWTRWFRRAVKKSVDQVRGAERWIAKYPDRIFIDKACTIPLPIPLPPPERRNVHGVVVALGASEACRRHAGGSGSLILNPDLKGDAHGKPDSPGYAPFTVGDIDPDGAFVHVVDDVTLDIILGELDTITDFTDYLEKKAAFVRSGNLAMAYGEEDILAYYMKRMNDRGEHDFTHPEGRPWRETDRIVFDDGIYAEMRRNPQYVAKKKADEVSYLWDRLIEAFTKHMLDGTTIVPDGESFTLSYHEKGVRHLALEPRFRRRMHARAILEAIELGKTAPRFTRALLPGPSEAQRDTGFFFMTLAYPEDIQLANGYEQYRAVRRHMAEAYAMGLMNRYRFLKRIVGIATEPPTASTGRRGSSEDLILLEPPEWTPELEAEADRLCTQYDIVQDGRFRETAILGQEYPEPAAATRERRHGVLQPDSRRHGYGHGSGATDRPLNRHERRALQARTRRNPRR